MNFLSTEASETNHFTAEAFRYTTAPASFGQLLNRCAF